MINNISNTVQHNYLNQKITIKSKNLIILSGYANYSIEASKLEEKTIV